MRIKKVVRMFRKGSVCVTGQRGTGKDMLIANVVCRRNEPYVSNIDYKSKKAQYQPFCYDFISLNGNTHNDLLTGTIKPYEFPYISGSDIYLSDIGVYFPSQYCNDLNKRYPSLPLFMALSRQLGDGCSVHLNVQNLGRAWDKIREQSDQYIMCRYCFVIFGFVFQGITIYDKADSCQARIKPCRLQSPLFNKTSKTMIRMYRDNFYNAHGTVKNKFLVYRNKSKYDTYYFKTLLKGEKNEENIVDC